MDATNPRSDPAGTGGDRETAEADAGETATADLSATDTATRDPLTPRSTRWLIVIASVLAVIATFSTWVKLELLDTDEWVTVSTELLAEPEVQQALTNHLANTLFERVDLAGDLEARLPDQLSGLAGPLAGALRDPITNAIGRLISSDRFAELWESANRAAHERMVAILRDETRPGVSASDGTVTLELGTILHNVGERVGIPTSALDRIPADAGNIVVFESDELASAQAVVQVLDFLSWFLYLFVVALYALAVVLARGAWRTALRNVGIALVIVGFAVFVVRGVGLRFAVGEFVQAQNESLGLLVGQVATRLVSEAAWTAIVYGVLVAGFAFLIGSSPFAVSVRRLLGRAAESVGAAIGLGTLAILLLLWWSPGRSFERPVSALVFTVTAIAGVAALVVISRREYSTARQVEQLRTQ